LFSLLGILSEGIAVTFLYRYDCSYALMYSQTLYIKIKTAKLASQICRRQRV